MQSHSSSRGPGYLHQVLDGEVVGEPRVPAVAPGAAVDGHAVLPLVGQEVPGVVAVTARVEATMGTDAASSPAVIGHYCVPDWAGNRGVLLFLFYKTRSQPE